MYNTILAIIAENISIKFNKMFPLLEIEELTYQ